MYFWIAKARFKSGKQGNYNNNNNDNDNDNDNGNDTLFVASCIQCFHFVQDKGLFRHLSPSVGKLVGHCTQSPIH